MVIGVFIKGLSALAKRVAKNKAKNLKKAKGVIKAKSKEANKAVQGRKKAAGSRETIRTKELLREQRARQTREFNARPGDVTPVGGKLVGRKARAQSSGVRDTINTLRSKIKNKEALRRNRNAKKVNLNQDFPPSKTAKPGSSLGTTKLSKGRPKITKKMEALINKDAEATKRRVGTTMAKIRERQRGIAAKKASQSKKLKRDKAFATEGKNKR